MKFMDTELKDIIVDLPFADGTTLKCGVYAVLETGGKTYFALLPLKGPKELDFSKNYMLYRVDEDAEHNPVISYIEDDTEYYAVADYFAKHYLNK